MYDSKDEWRKIGELNGLSIWQSKDKKLAIERDFEILCDLTPEELTQWEEQNKKSRHKAVKKQSRRLDHAILKTRARKTSQPNRV